jgi:large subunit ribosomal protein L2
MDMALKTFKPRTASLRFTVLLDNSDITKDYPERSLVESKRRHSGRSAAGRLTVRHKGGGHKRNYRIIDFRRDKLGIPAKVAAIEYDPNRSSRIALLFYVDGEKRYIIAPDGLKVGAMVKSGPGVEAQVGNAMPLLEAPLGAFVHNVELVPGGGGKLIRTAGGSAQVMSRETGFVQLKLRSGEVRLINERCLATIGQVGNADYSSVSEGKAGRRRWKGIRPTVRGRAMNPVDHPMGGGEGRAAGGGHPVSPWGRWAKGGKTRNRRKVSSRYIVSRRK